MNPLPTRHHPALVVLHWLLAALLLLALAMGTFVLKEMPNASPDKIGALRGHIFAAYPARWVHGAVATLLLILIGVHVAGAGYHQVVLKDRLLSRMGFGKRQAH